MACESAAGRCADARAGLPTIAPLSSSLAPACCTATLIACSYRFLEPHCLLEKKESPRQNGLMICCARLSQSPNTPQPYSVCRTQNQALASNRPCTPGEKLRWAVHTLALASQASTTLKFAQLLCLFKKDLASPITACGNDTTMYTHTKGGEDSADLARPAPLTSRCGATQTDDTSPEGRGGTRPALTTALPPPLATALRETVPRVFSSARRPRTGPPKDSPPPPRARDSRRSGRGVGSPSPPNLLTPPRRDCPGRARSRAEGRRAGGRPARAKAGTRRRPAAAGRPEPRAGARRGSAGAGTRAARPSSGAGPATPPATRLPPPPPPPPPGRRPEAPRVAETGFHPVPRRPRWSTP
jgi:hypothetical protein